MEDIPTLIAVLFPAASAYVPVIIALAALADAVLPQPLRDSRWVKARRLLSGIALNVRHARNAKAP